MGIPDRFAQASTHVCDSSGQPLACAWARTGGDRTNASRETCRIRWRNAAQCTVEAYRISATIPHLPLEIEKSWVSRVLLEPCLEVFLGGGQFSQVRVGHGGKVASLGKEGFDLHGFQ